MELDTIKQLCYNAKRVKSNKTITYLNGKVRLLVIKRRGSKAFILALLLLFTGCSNTTKIPDEVPIAQITEEDAIMSLETGSKIENVLEDKIYKPVENSNPISPNIFCADPTGVEYNGRLYVYGTNDHQDYEIQGDDNDNNYGNIKSLVIYSTDDMVNWTYEGIVNVEEVAPWIYNSWAPSIVSRVEDDGLTHFYLYFANGGAGVGVVTSTNPVGPWSDPLGGPLVYQNMEGLTNCPAPFDPGVCIDDNGVGWITFGGGRGEEEMPLVSKIARLGDDLLSIDSEIADIPAPYFFEANELNYINGTYVYTYNNNWISRDVWRYEDYEVPPACSMAYMTSKDPLNTDSWEYRGHYFLNAGHTQMDFCNNHTHYLKFKGQYYIIHHCMILKENMPTKGGFRSICVETLDLDEDTLEIKLTGGTRKGVEQIETLNPFDTQRGSKMASCASVGFAYAERGEVCANSLEAGCWTYIRGVEFNKSPDRFLAAVKGKGRIEIRLDDKLSDPVAAIDFDCEELTTVYTDKIQQIIGTHDMYIVFSGKDIQLGAWCFKELESEE